LELAAENPEEDALPQPFEAWKVWVSVKESMHKQEDSNQDFKVSKFAAELFTRFEAPEEEERVASVVESPAAQSDSPAQEAAQKICPTSLKYLTGHKSKRTALPQYSKIKDLVNHEQYMSAKLLARSISDRRRG